MSPTDMIVTVAVKTQTAITTATFIATSQTSPPTETSIPMSKQIVYYYFVLPAENAIPEGSVVVMPNTGLILAPTLTDITHTPDTVTNISAALEAMINDTHNRSTIGNLHIANLAFSEGHADVVLQGEVFGAGDVVLIAIRMMILMTVFADTSVQTAIITINGKNIANLGVSIERNAKPNDYMYTRAEIETFKAENAYVTP